MSRQMRRAIQRRFKLHGLTVRVDAVVALESVLSREDDMNGVLEDILTAIKARLDKGESSARDGVIGKEIVAQVVDQLSRNDEDMAQTAVTVVNAKQMPTLRYNGTRRNFFRVPGSANVAHAAAKAKTNMMRDRYVLLHQRIMRHPLFAPPMLGAQAAAGDGADAIPGHVELTQIESLVGSRGRRCIFGLLTERDRGEFYLEDQNSSVRLNLEHATHSAGLYTKGCFVLAEGEVRDEVFIVDVLGFPPPETRAQTLVAGGGRVDFLGLPMPTDAEREQMKSMEQDNEDAMFVVLSDVHLDNPSVMEKLHDLFTGFDVHSKKPPLFLFIGNFVSRPCGTGPEQVSMSQFREYLGKLGELIASFPALVEQSTFVLVPGPDDLGAANVLPRPPFPHMITKLFYEALGEYEHARITFASNPCRIKYYSQEIVVMRDNMIKKLRRNCVLTPVDTMDDPDEIPSDSDASSDDEDDSLSDSSEANKTKTKSKRDEVTPGPPQLSEHLVKTLMDQAHLCPLPSHVQPVQWTMDPSLRLYPLPDLLILADHYDQYQCKYADCAVFNPGPFNTDFSFVVYNPSTWATEFSSVGGEGVSSDEEEEEDAMDAESDTADVADADEVEAEAESAGNQSDSQSSTLDDREDERLDGDETMTPAEVDPSEQSDGESHSREPQVLPQTLPLEQGDDTEGRESGTVAMAMAEVDA
jgi:DNA polymerase epsilon subunit 2